MTSVALSYIEGSVFSLVGLLAPWIYDGPRDLGQAKGKVKMWGGVAWVTVLSTEWRSGMAT